MSSPDQRSSKATDRYSGAIENKGEPQTLSEASPTGDINTDTEHYNIKDAAILTPQNVVYWTARSPLWIEKDFRSGS